MVNRNSKGQFVKGSSGFNGKHTQETKDLISKKLIEKKLVTWNKGLTKETSDSVKRQSEWLIQNHPLRGKTPWNKDKPMSEESKIKESISKTGVPAKYFKMSKYHHIRSLFLKRKMNSSEKKVYDFIKQYVGFKWLGNIGICSDFFP